MKTSDFYYDLPEELIAQDPLTDRSSSRLMVLDKKREKSAIIFFTTSPGIFSLETVLCLTIPRLSRPA